MSAVLRVVINGEPEELEQYKQDLETTFALIGKTMTFEMKDASTGPFKKNLAGKRFSRFSATSHNRFSRAPTSATGRNRFSRASTSATGNSRFPRVPTSATAKGAAGSFVVRKTTSKARGKGGANGSMKPRLSIHRSPSSFGPPPPIGASGRSTGKGGKRGAGGGVSSTTRPRLERSRPSAGQPKQRFHGVIRKYNPRRGYFFVECSEISDKYKVDPVMWKDDAPKGAAEGSTIQFTAWEDSNLRNPVIQEVRLVK